VEPSRNIERLIEIMAALRDPDTGCPWDIRQTFAPYTIEEAYEVADAIERNDMADLRDELGDLLLQVAYHARLAEEAGSFAFGDVVEAITAKMINRHPHVFGDVAAADADAVLQNWEATKAEERRLKQTGRTPSSLDDVPRALPGLSRAAKLQKRAATVGFDWPNAAPVIDKIREELDELEEEMAKAGGNVEDELGDVLFSIANLARHLKVDPEQAMQRANTKFQRRFKAMERDLAVRGTSIEAASAASMEEAWERAKAAEKQTSG
jgi:MazG family protein